MLFWGTQDKTLKKSVIIANLQRRFCSLRNWIFCSTHTTYAICTISKNVLLSQIEQQLLSSVANSPNYDIKCHAGEAEHS